MQFHSRPLVNDRIMLLVAAAALWTGLANELPGQTVPSKPTAAPVASVRPTAEPSKVSESQNDATAIPPGESENARKLRDKLRTQFAEQNPKELAEAARGIGNEAKAKFQFGRVIAVWRAREIRMTEQRVELRKQADQRIQDRTKERTKLDTEIEQVQQQFQADKVQCERQLTELIQSYRPRLQQLKDEATRATELADKTDAKLAEIRREILSLEQQARLVTQGKPAKPSRALIVDLEYEDKDDPFALRNAKQPATATTAATKPSQSVEQMLKDLD